MWNSTQGVLTNLHHGGLNLNWSKLPMTHQTGPHSRRAPPSLTVQTPQSHKSCLPPRVSRRSKEHQSTRPTDQPSNTKGERKKKVAEFCRPIRSSPSQLSILTSRSFGPWTWSACRRSATAATTGTRGCCRRTGAGGPSPMPTTRQLLRRSGGRRSWRRRPRHRSGCPTRRGCLTSSHARPSSPSRDPTRGTSRPCCSPTPSRSTTSRSADPPARPLPWSLFCSWRFEASVDWSRVRPGTCRIMRVWSWCDADYFEFTPFWCVNSVMSP